MEESLLELGLNNKEIAIYLLLLKNKDLTALEISKKLNITRTNTYMVLDQLKDKELVIQDSSKTTKFSASKPQNLKSLLDKKKQKIEKTNAMLNASLPEMMSVYNLTHHQPGVVYREGMDGLKESLEDMTKSNTDILLYPSKTVEENRAVYKVLMNAAYKRKVKGIKTKALLYDGGRKFKNINEWPRIGYNVRFSGDHAHEGELAIYDDKVVLTAFTPEIVVTTITNSIIADSLRAVFFNAWGNADTL